MSGLTSIDPGVKLCGWARFEDSLLAYCGLVRTKATDLDEQRKDLTRALQFEPIFIDSAQHVVIERPEVYRKLKGDPNDLIALAIIVGAVAQAASPFAEVSMPLPKEWKGQVPKEVSKRRMRKKLAQDELDRLEFALSAWPKSLGHNITDAVALGLWRLNR